MPSNTDRARQLAAELRSLNDDDEVTETQIIVQGGTVHVGETGRHRALKSTSEPPTAPSNPRPSHGYPERVSRALAPLLGGLPPWGRVIVLLALIGVLALVVWRGGAGLKLWP